MDSNASSPVVASILPGLKGYNFGPQIDQALAVIYNVSPWTVLFTLFAMCVVYDQGTSIHS